MDSGEDDLYECNLSGQCLGKALIICNSFEDGPNARKGANKDFNNMQEMLQALKFNTEESCFLDTNLDKLKRELKKIADSKELEQYQSFVCVISSHGHEEECRPINSGQLLRSDLKTYRHVLAMKNNTSIGTDEILEMFDDKHCAALKGKPKMFFIQACRNRTAEIESAMDSGVEIGEQCESRGDAITNHHSVAHRSAVDPVILQPRVQTSQGAAENLSNSQASATVPNFQEGVRVLNSRRLFPVMCRNNFLVMYSCVSGAIGWRDEEYGSWLLFKLYAVVTEKIKKRQNFSLVEMVTEVIGRVSRDCESSVVKDNDPNELNEERSFKKCAPVYESKLTKEVNFRLF